MNEKAANSPQHLLRERMTEMRLSVIPLCVSALGSSAEVLTTIIRSDLDLAEHALESGDIGEICEAIKHLEHYPF